MKKETTVKGLQSQLNKSKGEYDALKVECANKQRQLANKKNEIEILEIEILKLNKKGNIIKVSEHAVLRYLERVSGLSIENVEKLILNESVTKLILKLGCSNGTYPAEGFKVVLKDNVVVTIIPDK